MADGEAAWLEILLHLYRSDHLTCELSDGEFLVEGKALDNLTTLSVEEIETVVRKLGQTGLLREVGQGEFLLTEQGLETAREHYLDGQRTARRGERADRQRSVTVASLYASVGILLLGLFSLVASVAAQLGVSPLALIFLAVVGTVIVLTLFYSVISEMAPELGQIQGLDVWKTESRDESAGRTKEPDTEPDRSRGGQKQGQPELEEFE